METIYQTTVHSVGPLASQFLEEKMMVLFKDDAPEDLAEFCVLHRENDWKKEIRPGDVLVLGEKEYIISAIGEAVNRNLKSLGHITVRFTGESEADLPGTMIVEAKEMVELGEGSVIRIVRMEEEGESDA